MSVIKMKIVSTILFNVLLTSLVSFTSSQPNQLLQTEFNLFLQRLESALNSTGFKRLRFELTVGVIQNLKLTSDEFKNLCLQYEAELVETGDIPLSVMALHSTIEYIFYHYKMSLDNYSKTAIEEIQRVDPIGLNVYLTKKMVKKSSQAFMDFVLTFLRTMYDRLRLIKMKTDNSVFSFLDRNDYENVKRLPNDIRNEIATEYLTTSNGPIDMFTDLVTELTSKKMYRLETDDFDVYRTLSLNTIDDVQIIYGTYKSDADDKAGIQKTYHAVCINFKASTQKVHIYDSLMDHRLDDRQLDIIDKLYPYNLGIIFERPSALQDHHPTCALFAMTYATMLLLDRDPAVTPIKINTVHGDKTLYMRMHILNMLATRKLFLME